jgi:hypothetical protein
MSKNIPNVNRFYTEFHNSQQSVIVALDIEHIVLISDAVNTVERPFDIGKTVPSGTFRLIEPIFQCCFGIVVLAVK